MNIYSIDSLYIEITSDCNLRCKHCYNNSGLNIIELSYDKIIKILDYCAEKKCENLTISGGEPILHPDFFKVIDYASSRFKNIIIGTNATMLDQKNVKKLKKYEIEMFQVSVDGSSEKENDFIRGEGSFKKMFNGISILKEFGYAIRVNFVLTNNNHSNLEGVVKLLISQGVKVIKFSFLNKLGRALENNDEILNSIDNYEELYKELKELNEKYKNTVFLDITSFSNINSKCYLCNLNFEKEKRFNSIRVDYMGDIFLCQRFIDKSHSVGNVKNTHLINEKKINEMLIDINKCGLLVQKCNFCFFKEFCAQPCPAEIMSGSIKGYNDDLCSLRLQELTYDD